MKFTVATMAVEGAKSKLVFSFPVPFAEWALKSFENHLSKHGHKSTMALRKVNKLIVMGHPKVYQNSYSASKPKVLAIFEFGPMDMLIPGLGGRGEATKMKGPEQWQLKFFDPKYFDVVKMPVAQGCIAINGAVMLNALKDLEKLQESEMVQIAKDLIPNA